ncbi:MAG: hypothetical protein AAF934_09775 [Bacteroidota bacterium]
MNKRHYNYKYEELNALIDLKYKEDYKDKVYKGEYMTYKYKTYEYS